MTSFFRRFLIVLTVSVAAAYLSPTASADTGAARIGIVIMHGKGGSPKRIVSDLASALERQGYLVANLEMPWSGRREYDVDVAAAEKEVESALAALRGKGAQKLFVAGHSQGGLFALYFAGKHALDGVIAIAPGGSADAQVFREKLGDSVALARKLIAQGKSQEKTRFSDYEGSRGTYPVVTTPAAYLSWFDPDGAMNQMAALRNMSPDTPVLYIAPTGDYPGLRKLKQKMFDALPKNPRTKLYEPDSSHLNAPTASIGEIVEWTTAVANAR